MQVEKIQGDWPHEEVYRLSDPDGWVALHRPSLGTCFGGTRFRSYASPDDALQDVLLLSEAMTWKCAINGLPGAGGKVVLIANAIDDARAAYEAVGEFVESLGGRFVTGGDFGTGAEETAIIASRTSYVAQKCLSQAAGDGVYYSLLGALDAAGIAVKDASIVIQGLGGVGGSLARRLLADNASVIGADPDDAICRTFEVEGMSIVPVETCLETEATVLAPCAIGGVISEEIVPRLTVKIICGGANNMLTSDGVADSLKAAGITYVPDFLANSGATIQGVLDTVNGDGDYTSDVAALRERTRELIESARASSTTPLVEAMRRIQGVIHQP